MQRELTSEQKQLIEKEINKIGDPKVKIGMKDGMVLIITNPTKYKLVPFELYRESIDYVSDLRGERKDFIGEIVGLKKQIGAYKECFEKFIPLGKWDEASLFLSTYGSGLAKELARREEQR